MSVVTRSVDGSRAFGFGCPARPRLNLLSPETHGSFFMKSNSLSFAPALMCVCISMSLSSTFAAAQAVSGVPEEVTIVGSRMLLQLRTRMLEAEEQAYAVFNQFNDEARFDIQCSWQDRTGSHMRVRVCVPKFQLDAQAAHARSFLSNYRDYLDAFSLPDTTFTGHQPMEAVIASQQPDYKRKLEQVAIEHPEFLDSLMDYSALRQQYEAAIGIRVPEE